MGKGDKKTRPGKIWRGSYGNVRPHHPAKKNTGAAPKTAAGVLAKKKKK